jgi:hypothetical protein
MVIRMDLLPVQLSQRIQPTTVTLTSRSQQLLISMAILIFHLRLLQALCIIIHIHTLIRPRLLTYLAHPPIHILHPIRQPIVLTIHIYQPRQSCTTHIRTSMSRIICIRTRIPQRSLMYILIHHCRMTILLRTCLSQCQRAIVAPEGQ